MMVSPISFDLSASGCSLPDASGLAPLELPAVFFERTAPRQFEQSQTPIQMPSDESIRRFQTAMGTPLPNEETVPTIPPIISEETVPMTEVAKGTVPTTKAVKGTVPEVADISTRFAKSAKNDVINEVLQPSRDVPPLVAQVPTDDPALAVGTVPNRVTGEPPVQLNPTGTDPATRNPIGTVPVIEMDAIMGTVPMSEVVKGTVPEVVESPTKFARSAKNDVIDGILQPSHETTLPVAQVSTDDSALVEGTVPTPEAVKVAVSVMSTPSANQNPPAYTQKPTPATTIPSLDISSQEKSQTITAAPIQTPVEGIVPNRRTGEPPVQLNPIETVPATAIGTVPAMSATNIPTQVDGTQELPEVAKGSVPKAEILLTKATKSAKNDIIEGILQSSHETTIRVAQVTADDPALVEGTVPNRRTGEPPVQPTALGTVPATAIGTVPAMSATNIPTQVDGIQELPEVAKGSVPMVDEVVLKSSSMAGRSVPNPSQRIESTDVDVTISAHDNHQPTIDIPITSFINQNPPTYTQNSTTSIPHLDKSPAIATAPIQVPVEGSVPTAAMTVPIQAPVEGSVPKVATGTVPTPPPTTTMGPVSTATSLHEESVPMADATMGSVPMTDVKGTLLGSEGFHLESVESANKGANIEISQSLQEVRLNAAPIQDDDLDIESPIHDSGVEAPILEASPMVGQTLPRQPQWIAPSVVDEPIDEQPVVIATEKPVADITPPTTVDMPNGKQQPVIATPVQEPVLSLPEASGLMPLELPETNFAKFAANDGERNQTPFRNSSDDSVRRFQRAMDVSASVQLPTEQIPIPNPGLGAMPEVSVGDASTRTAEIAETVSRIIEAVSEQIEVRPAMVRGEEEVVIRLKPTVLGGSEIKLSAKDGILSLEITPATPVAEQLVARNIPQLERALAEHIPAFHGFTVAVKRGRNNEGK